MLVAGTTVATAADSAAIERGRYIFDAAGCFGCHTGDKGEGPALAGDRPLETPFGAFHTPNITPDPAHGIGRWTFADFEAAMREGRRPDGSYYYPAFPYTSYTGVSDADLADLWAYLQTVAPQPKPSQSHDLSFPFNQRWLMGVWQALFFTPGRSETPAGRSPEWQRGAYLVEVLGHCGECHSPRNAFGAVDRDAALAGNGEADHSRVPGIRSADLRDWSEVDIATMLKSGMMPDGDFVGGEMAEVVENSTSRLTHTDRGAIAVYLKSLD